MTTWYHFSDFVFGQALVGSVDYVTNPGSVVPVKMWTAQTGGTQITTLLDVNNNPVTQITPAANGQAQWAAQVPEVWADAGAGRVLIAAYDYVAASTDAAVAPLVPPGSGSATGAALAATYGSVIVHGSTAGTARPTGAVSVLWIGSVSPTNAVDGDGWLNTTNSDQNVHVSGVFTPTNRTTNDARYVAKSQQVLNILDYSVSTGTSADQSTAILAALTANPGVAFRFPPGNYRCDNPLNITTNNSLILSQGARIYANTAMDILVNYDNGLTVTNYTQDAGIFESGMIDGNLLANKCLAVGSVIRFTLGDGLTLRDGIYRGLLTKSAGAEVISNNLRIYNTGTTNSHYTASVTTTNTSPNVTAASGTPFSAADAGSPISGAGIPQGTTILSVTDSTHIVLSANATASATVTATVLTNIAVEANMGDCTFNNLVTRDCTVGIWDKGSNTWNNPHPWIGTTTQLTTRYPVSIGFLLDSNAKLDGPYADTYRYSFQTQAASGNRTVRIVSPRVFANTGNLTSGLASANPGVCYNLLDGAKVVVAGTPKYQGASTAHALLAGSTIRFDHPRTWIDDVPGSVTGLFEYHRGVQMGTTSFACSVFGSTSGTATLTTNSCTAEVRDGVVEFRFILVGSIPASGFAGKVRIGIASGAFPQGATATNTGVGTLSYLSSSVNPSLFNNVVACFSAGLGSPGTTVVQLNTVGTGSAAEPDSGAAPSTIASSNIQIWGRLVVPFTYPS